MKKIIFFIFLNCFLMRQTVAAYHANVFLGGDAILDSGNITYKGKSLSDLTVNVGQLVVNLEIFRYIDNVNNDNKNIISYAQHLTELFYLPESIYLNGRKISITNVTPTGRFDEKITTFTGYQGYENSVYWTYPSGISVKLGDMLSRLKTITIPSFSFTISGIDYLDSGVYTGFIPIYFGAQLRWWSDKSYPTSIIPQWDLISTYASKVEIPYTIEINNSCDVSDHSIDFDYGTIAANELNGKEMTSAFTVSCVNSGKVKISVVDRSAPFGSYTNGVGVGLGNNVDAVLTIGNTGLSDSVREKELNVTANTPTSINITSKLVAPDNATYNNGASLNGSAVVNVSFE